MRTWGREDVLTARALFDDVADSRDAAAFWWLGQHTFIVRLGGTVLLIDPFLTEMEERNVPPLFSPADAAGIVDLVLCTHDHLDHIDPGAIPGLASETNAHFVAPAAHADRMHSLGVPKPRLSLLNDGESIEVSGVRIHAVKSAHEFFDETPEGLYPFLGYVVKGSGKAFYHSGDTVWWEGLQARLKRWKLDAAMVPINGRDAKRLAMDIIGNMTYQEAADLVGGLDVALTVPAHYDMFDANSEDPQLLVDYMQIKYPGRKVWVGGYAEKVVF